MKPVQARERTTAALLAFTSAGTAWALLQVAGPYLRAVMGEPWGPALAVLVAVGVPAAVGARIGSRMGIDVGLRRPGPRALLAGLGTGLGLPGIGGLVVALLGTSSLDAEPRGSFLALLAASALVPAVCEEVLARGLVIGALLRVGPGWAAVGVAALVSAALHGSWAAQVSATAQGLVLGLLAVRAQSTWPAVLAHALANAGILAIVAAGIALPVPLLLLGATMALVCAMSARRRPSSKPRPRARQSGTRPGRRPPGASKPACGV